MSRLLDIIDQAITKRATQNHFQATVLGPGTDINGNVIPNQIAIQRTGESGSDGGSYRVLGGYPAGAFNLQDGDLVLMEETSPGNIICMGQIGA
jgi:hypothetical protein